jgi:diguanylate cyclase (GGDEF)-like protein
MKKRTTIMGALLLSMLVILTFIVIVILALWFNQYFAADAQSFENSSLTEFFLNVSGFQLATMIAAGAVMSFLVVNYIASNIKKNFNRFNHFFHQAAYEGKMIDEDQLNFEEFKTLAHTVNEMTRKANIAKKRLEFKEKYLQTVLDTQKNIIIVKSHGELVRANQAFFDFFGVKDLDEFKQKHECISDFFEKVNENGYLDKNPKGITWVRYILKNPLDTHKVKIIKDKDDYIFEVNAKVSEVDDNYIVVITFNNISELEMQRKAFEIASTIDALTRVANRLKFNMILQQQIEMSKRYKHNFSLILFDIDKFKQINDTYGHKTGDNILVELALLIKNTMRKSDTFARWGGEEFAIILPQTDLQTAAKIAEKVRKRVADHDFEDGLKVTCSFGVCEYKEEYDLETLVKFADEKLYKAKHQGRNQVQF